MQAGATNSLVAGRYEQGELVARGAMGAVHRAVDVTSGRTVALKLLEVFASEQVHRFGREVRALRALEHPAIVGYVDHGRTEEGQPFLVMEWIEGETLEARRARGPMPPSEVLAVAHRLAGALEAIHARGIVHRDLKPSNVLLAGGDPARAMLLDFGVAHLTAQSLGATRTGSIVGTPEFMSPEQARGESQVGPEADVFALGAVLYECLTGASAFGARQLVGTLAKVLFSEPTPILDRRPDAPPALAALIARMLAKDRDARPRNGAALREALAALPVEAAPAAAPAPDSQRPGLGRDEQAVLTVVLAAAARSAPAQSGAEERRELPTVLDVAPRLEGIAHAVADLGVALQPLGNGGAVATVTHGAAPLDRIRAACRAALRIAASAPDLCIAVATGHASVAAEVPVGRVIDRASLLLERGGSEGAVRIDDATAGLIGADFRVGGDESGLVLFEELDRGDAARRLMGRETPLVGRKRELRMIELTYAQCRDDGSARAVVVTGAPGAGKSRLRYELLRRLAAGEEPPTVLVAWGDPLRADSPLACLAAMVRREAGIAAGEEPSLARARLRARVGRSLPPEARDRHVPFLGELAAVPFDDAELPALRAARRDPRLMADRVRQAFETWIAAESALAPVLLVIDDAHWADLASAEVALGLLRTRASSRVLVLVLGREELDARFAGLLDGRHAVDRIALRELPDRAARELVLAVLGEGADEATVRHVVELAGGNAFFLEELIRAVAQGAGERLPESVASMVQARLGALDPEARRALRAASVFGEVSWRGGIAALLGARGEDALDAHLDALVRAEILTPRSPARFPAEREYVFRHALVCETAYGMLAPEDRVLGHRLAGAWLEARGEHDVLTLAEHFERGERRDRAAHYLVRAARAALAAQDIATAGGRVERGLALATAAGASAAVLSALGAEVARWSGRPTDALAHARAALPGLTPGSAEWLHAAGEAIAASARLGDYDASEALAREVERAEARGAEDASRRVHALCVAARALFHAGRYAAAEERIASVRRLAAEGGLDPSAEAEVHRVEAARARQFGDPQGDADGYAAALACYERAGDEREACNTAVSLGFALAELGELAAAEAHLRGARERAEALGLHPITARADHNLGMVLCELGRLEEARAVEGRAIEAALAAEDRRLEGGSRVYLSQIALASGDLEGADREARAAIDAFERTPPARAGALAALARALAAKGDPAAIDAAEEAAALLCALGAIEEYEALVHLALAEACLATGRDPGPALREGVARLEARARFVPTEAARARFLTGDSINARLLALARARGSVS